MPDPYGSDSFHQRAGDVRTQRLIGFVGQALIDHTTREITVTNKNPQAAQVTTMDVTGSFSAGTERTFTITVGGTVTTVSYTSVAGDTDLTGVATSIVAQVNATEAVRGFLSASNSGVTITFTGTYPGISFTIAESDSNLGTPSTTTSAATADTVKFGRAIISTSFDGASRLGGVPVTTDFTAQVVAYQIDNTAAGALFVAKVTIRGVTYVSDPVAHSTNAAGTAAAIATELNSNVLPANSVLAGNSSAVLTFTAENPGEEFTAELLSVGSVDGQVSRNTASDVGPSTATSLARAMTGVSIRDEHIENITRGGDDPAYPANYGVRTLAAGRIVVSNAQDPSYGDAVYVSTDTATKGQFYNAGGANLVYLPPSVAEWDRNEPSTQAQDTAVLRINTGRVY